MQTYSQSSFKDVPFSWIHTKGFPQTFPISFRSISCYSYYLYPKSICTTISSSFFPPSNFFRIVVFFSIDAFLSVSLYFSATFSFFSFKFCSHILHSGHSFPSLPSSQSLPFPSPSKFPQKRAGLPETSRKHSKTSYNKTTHITSYQVSHLS